MEKIINDTVTAMVIKAFNKAIEEWIKEFLKVNDLTSFIEDELDWQFDEDFIRKMTQEKLRDKDFVNKIIETRVLNLISN